MNQIKKIINNLTVESYFILKNCSSFNLEHFIIPMLYILNFFEINIYINSLILVCTIIYKLYIDLYVTDRFISTLVLVFSLFFNLFNWAFLFFLLLLISDTIWYKNIIHKRRINIDHLNVEKILLYNNDDDDDDNNGGVFLLDDDNDF